MPSDSALLSLALTVNLECCRRTLLFMCSRINSQCSALPLSISFLVLEIQLLFGLCCDSGLIAMCHPALAPSFSWHSLSLLHFHFSISLLSLLAQYIVSFVGETFYICLLFETNSRYVALFDLYVIHGVDQEASHTQICWPLGPPKCWN